MLRVWFTADGVAGFTSDLDGFVMTKPMAGQTTGYTGCSRRGEQSRVDLLNDYAVGYIYASLGWRIVRKVSGVGVEQCLR